MTGPLHPPPIPQAPLVDVSSSSLVALTEVNRRRAFEKIKECFSLLMVRRGRGGKGMAAFERWHFALKLGEGTASLDPLLPAATAVPSKQYDRSQAHELDEDFRTELGKIGVEKVISL